MSRARGRVRRTAMASRPSPSVSLTRSWLVVRRRPGESITRGRSMEQTALRPKPLPGREPGGGRSTPARRPHAARRRGRRLRALLFALFAGTVLVLSGVGLGTVGAPVIGMSGLAELQRQAGQA